MNDAAADPPPVRPTPPGVTSYMCMTLMPLWSRQWHSGRGFDLTPVIVAGLVVLLIPVGVAVQTWIAARRRDPLLLRSAGAIPATVIGEIYGWKLSNDVGLWSGTAVSLFDMLGLAIGGVMCGWLFRTVAARFSRGHGQKQFLAGSVVATLVASAGVLIHVVIAEPIEDGVMFLLATLTGLTIAIAAGLVLGALSLRVAKRYLMMTFGKGDAWERPLE
jgi:hypothetical protein